MPVNLILGEFKEGKAKGFRYYYPTFSNLQEASDFFGVEDITESSYLLMFLNTNVKQAYSERVRQKVIPADLNGNALRNYLVRLADKFPDGILLNKEEAMLLKPWRKITSVEEDILRLVATLTKASAEEQTIILEKIREKQKQEMIEKQAEIVLAAGKENNTR